MKVSGTVCAIAILLVAGSSSAQPLSADEDCYCVLTELDDRLDLETILVGYREVLESPDEVYSRRQLEDESYDDWYPDRHWDPFLGSARPPTVFRRDAIFHERSIVPLRTNHGIGFSFYVPEIQNHDRLILELMVEPPRPVKVDGRWRERFKARVDYRAEESRKQTDVVWMLDRDGLQQAGTWIVSLHNGNQMLLRRSFRVVETEAASSGGD